MTKIMAYREASTTITGATECSVFLEPPLKADFPRHLLTELFALARPVGLGAITAFAQKESAAEDLLEAALQHAGEGRPGHRRRRDAYWFDYVGGYRVKVWLCPLGLETDPGYPASWFHPGWPAILSNEFDTMYGTGALENAVRIALDR